MVSGIRVTAAFLSTAQGNLVNSEGYYVQGSRRIYVGSDDFTVDEEGNIYVDGELTDKFSIVTFDDLTTLRKDGSNLFYSTSRGAQASTDTAVMQGALECSNVDTAEELTRLLSVSNAYQTNQRVLGMVDESLEKAVNEVGKVG